MQLDEFKNYLKLNLDSDKSRVQYWYRMKMFFKKYAIFNQETVNDFLASCVDNQLKTSTFNGYMTALKHYTRFKKLDIEFPKQKKITKKKKKAFLTLKELEEEILPYFDLLFEKDSEQRKLIVRLMFCSGLRPDEIIKLKKQDLDFKNNWIIVRNTKDKEDRMTLLVPQLQLELKKLCESSQGEKLFNISEIYIKYTFQKINEMLGYKRHLNAYQCRHGFCHHCLSQGIDLKRVKEMMGHWDIKMTEEYLTLEPKEIIDVAVKKFKFRKGKK